MHKHVLFALAAGAAGAAAAQGAARPDPADPGAKVPAFEYRSAFEGYRADREQKPAPWREANDEMGRLGGHVGHVPGSLPPAKAAARPGGMLSDEAIRAVLAFIGSRWSREVADARAEMLRQAGVRQR